MRDRKSLYLLILALIVVTVSITLISVWGYRFYFSKHANASVASLNAKTLQVKKANGLQLLDSVIQQLNNPADTIRYDSSDRELACKIIQLNKLKNDIAFILKNRSFAKDSASGSTVGELQKKVNELQDQNDEIIKENFRLKERITQLADNNQKEEQAKSIPGKSKDQPVLSLPLLVTHLRFAAYNNDQKTSVAKETRKLTGSFEINVKPNNTTTTIYVVIVQPDGKVLLSGSGGSDTFETISGIKHYCAVVTFDNQKDNHKRVGFSVNSDVFRKGKYLMQIYHRGIMIGRLAKTLY